MNANQRDPSVDQFIARFRHHLRGMPETERADAVREIASHIAESQAHGRAAADVLACLGSPEALARAYQADYYTQTERTFSLVALFKLLGWSLGTGVTSLLLIPLLSLMTLVLGAAALLSPVFGILRTFGAQWIIIGSSNGAQAPTAWSLPILLGLGALCAVVAWGTWRLLRWYVMRLMAQYRRLVPTLAY